MNEAQQQKEKEKLEYLSHLIATISPDPIKSKHCTKCNGKGWRTIDVAVSKDEIHYKVELCCGIVGTSPYSKLTAEISLLKGQLNILSETTNTLANRFNYLNDLLNTNLNEIKEVQKYQLWRSVCLFFKRKAK
jgi:hypothetical protein